MLLAGVVKKSAHSDLGKMQVTSPAGIYLISLAFLCGAVAGLLHGNHISSSLVLKSPQFHILSGFLIHFASCFGTRLFDLVLDSLVERSTCTRGLSILVPPLKQSLISGVTTRRQALPTCSQDSTGSCRSLLLWYGLEHSWDCFCIGS